MRDDGLQWIEAALGAVSKITPDDTQELVGARCPKCDASNFVRVSDLYAEAVGRLQESAGATGRAETAGMSDRQIVAKFSPPRPGSLMLVAIGVGGPLAAIAYYVYRRFGDSVGQVAIVVALIAIAIVLLTSARRFSDQYYHRRRRWNSLFMCRQCAQLVAS